MCVGRGATVLASPITRGAGSPVWASVPFFAHSDGSPVCTSDVKTFVRQAAEAAGEPDPEDFDAKSRIGGATDLYYLMGGAAEAE